MKIERSWTCLHLNRRGAIVGSAAFFIKHFATQHQLKSRNETAATDSAVALLWSMASDVRRTCVCPSALSLRAEERTSVSGFLASKPSGRAETSFSASWIWRLEKDAFMFFIALVSFALSTLILIFSLSSYSRTVEGITAESGSLILLSMSGQSTKTIVNRSKIFYLLKIHARKYWLVAREEHFALTIQNQFFGRIHMTIYWCYEECLLSILSVVILSVNILFPEKVCYFHFKQFGNLHKITQIWLTSISTPFWYGCFVLSQLYSKPFAVFFFLREQLLACLVLYLP